MSRSVVSVLASLLLGACAAAPSDSESRLAGALEREIALTAGEAVEVTALVVSLEDGRTLFARHPRRLCRPASTLKLVTAATVLVNGFGDREARTALGLTPDGGPLFLQGGADAFLSSEDIPDIARAVRDVGIELLTAPLVADATLFQGPRFGVGWMWDDEPEPFMPHISALTLDGGCVTLRVGAEGLPPHGAGTPLEGLRIEDHPESSGPPRIERDWRSGGNRVRVHGRPAPGAVLEVRFTVAQPHLQAAYALKSALVREGITAPDLPVVDAAFLPPDAPYPEKWIFVRSRPVREMITRTLKDSDNLGAECLLRLTAVWAGTLGTAEAGLHFVGRYLESLGHPPTSYRIVDGSGVSHYNLITAELLVDLLRDLHRRPELLPLFREALPIAGEDGTLESRMLGTPAAGRVRAKTGTLSGVSCLAGYVESADGEPCAFAIMIQDFVGPPAPWRDLQNRLCAILAATETRTPEATTPR